jgi:hypothetical protein
METTVKIDTQVIEQQVLAYLHKTAKHLFISEDSKMFFKVIPINVNGEWYYVTIKFNGDKCYTSINSVKKRIEWNDSKTKRVIQQDLFPQHYDKNTSIPNFKAMRGKTFEIIKYVQTNFNGKNEDEIKQGIGKILEGMTPKV